MRVLKKIVLGVVGGILAIYLLFAVGLTVLEWIVRENPKVEESLEAHSTAPHTLTHFDQGAASFHRRLELIASAKQSIALEFFIYDVDEAARLLTQALMNKLGKASGCGSWSTSPLPYSSSNLPMPGCSATLA